ncbi:hypothetical protein ACFW5V_32565 [Streptomyces sp. NPDC058762]|uniref:hypothetical protein n=1 Tax=Streptomyces sp. NPDC058762 TaxID=3346629 RepID=UPI0036B1BB8C
MYFARVSALAVPLSAAEQDHVYRAAEVAGKDVDDFMRDAILAAANDPFLAALEQAAETIAARDEPRHDFAN